MERKNWIRDEWLQFAILLLPFVVVVALWNQFPARVAIHWGAQGRPDGWASKDFGLLLFPVLNIGFCALLVWVPRLDRRMRLEEEKYARILRIIRVLRFAITGLFALISVMIAAFALGANFNMGRLAFNGSLVLLLVLGNFLGVLQPNRTAGIRTPWTMKNAEVWRATHRLGGRLMVFGALILFALEPVLSFSAFVCAYVASILGFVAWGYFYSYHRFQLEMRSPGSGMAQ